MFDHIQLFNGSDEIVEMSIQDYYDEYTRLINQLNNYHYSIIYLNDQARDLRVSLWNDLNACRSYGLTTTIPSHRIVPDWIRRSLTYSSIVQLLGKFNFILWKSYIINIFARSRSELMRASLIALSEPSIRKWINRSPQSAVRELIDVIVNIPNSIIDDINIHIDYRVNEFFKDAMSMIKSTNEFECEDLIHYINSFQNVNDQLIGRIIRCMDKINMCIGKVKNNK
jgi:hypothetical protein